MFREDYPDEDRCSMLYESEYRYGIDFIDERYRSLDREKEN